MQIELQENDICVICVCTCVSTCVIWHGNNDGVHIDETIRGIIQSNSD